MPTSSEVQAVPVVDLGSLLDAGDGAVVTLVAGETQLAAHRAVLSARSPLFAAMFGHDMLESSSGQVEIPDVEGPVLRQLVSYCYSLQVPQMPAMAPQLLVAADKYGLSALKAACEQQVAAQLQVENAAAAAVLAVRHSCPSLTDAAVEFISAHTCKVMGTQGWADAVRNLPEAVVEVGRLLAQSAPETRTPATAGGRPTPGTHRQPQSDHRQTPDAAAAPTTLPHLMPQPSLAFGAFLQRRDATG